MKTIQLLILEDNPDDYYLLEETLISAKEVHFQVTLAENLSDLLEKAKSNTFDAALLDLNVPDSFGLDTLTDFHSRYPAIPAIIVTGVNDSEIGIRAVQYGAQDFITKNEITSKMIVKIIRHAIERQKLTTQLERAQFEIRGLLKGARAILEQSDFTTTARKVFDICSDIIGSTSGYVALLSKDGEENEVLFLEAGGLPCTVDPELPMPIRGLRETAYRTNSTVYDNDFMNSEWIKFMPEGHVRLENVMFAPLVVENNTVGIIGLANKKTGFTEGDARIASGFGEMAAIALQNNRNLDRREATEKQNVKLIQELRKALENVKTLSGLLPICSYCKKIRDDKGYWNQIESYLHQHSDAEFSHGICQECARKYYPDMDLYEE